MDNIIDILHKGNYSCVIKNSNTIRSFTQRGVNDLYYLFTNEPDFLRGAIVADKIVGKAAAAIMIAGGVKSLYTDIISIKAIDVLKNSNTVYNFKTQIDVVINRDKTNMCPLEKACFDITKIPDIIKTISLFLNSISK